MNEKLFKEIIKLLEQAAKGAYKEGWDDCKKGPTPKPDSHFQMKAKSKLQIRNYLFPNNY